MEMTKCPLCKKDFPESDLQIEEIKGKDRLVCAKCAEEHKGGEKMEKAACPFCPEPKVELPSEKLFSVEIHGSKFRVCKNCLEHVQELLDREQLADEIKTLVAERKIGIDHRDLRKVADQDVLKSEISGVEKPSKEMRVVFVFGKDDNRVFRGRVLMTDEEASIYRSVASTTRTFEPALARNYQAHFLKKLADVRENGKEAIPFISSVVKGPKCFTCGNQPSSQVPLGKFGVLTTNGNAELLCRNCLIDFSMLCNLQFPSLLEYVQALRFYVTSNIYERVANKELGKSSLSLHYIARKSGEIKSELSEETGGPREMYVVLVPTKDDFGEWIFRPVVVSGEERRMLGYFIPDLQAFTLMRARGVEQKYRTWKTLQTNISISEMREDKCALTAEQLFPMLGYEMEVSHGDFRVIEKTEKKPESLVCTSSGRKFSDPEELAGFRVYVTNRFGAGLICSHEAKVMLAMTGQVTTTIKRFVEAAKRTGKFMLQAANKELNSGLSKIDPEQKYNCSVEVNCQNPQKLFVQINGRFYPTCGFHGHLSHYLSKKIFGMEMWLGDNKRAIKCIELLKERKKKWLDQERENRRTDSLRKKNIQEKFSGDEREEAPDTDKILELLRSITRK